MVDVLPPGLTVVVLFLEGTVSVLSLEAVSVTPAAVFSVTVC